MLFAGIKVKEVQKEAGEREIFFTSFSTFSFVNGLTTDFLVLDWHSGYFSCYVVAVERKESCRSLGDVKR